GRALGSRADHRGRAALPRSPGDLRTRRTARLDPRPGRLRGGRRAGVLGRERVEMTTVVLAPPAPLALQDLGRLAAGAAVEVDAGVPARMRASQRQVEALLRSGRAVYGLNTGVGPLCEHVVPPEASARFQQNLVRCTASGFGPSHPAEVVRA